MIPTESMLSDALTGLDPVTIPQTVLDALPHDCWIMDRQGRYVLQNRHSQRTWGPLTGRTLSDVGASPQHVAQWRENDSRALAGAQVACTFQRLAARGKVIRSR